MKLAKQQKSKSIQINRLAVGLLAICLFGYPAAGVLSAIINLPTMYTSVPYRALVASLACILVIISWQNPRTDYWRLLFLLFILLFSLRLTYNYSEGYPGATKEFLLFFSTCALPSIALMNFHINDIERNSSLILIGLISAILTSVIVGEYIGAFGFFSMSFTGRLSLTSINPITLGHLSASLLLILLSWYLKGKHKGYWFFPLALTFLGFGGLSYAGSRGAYLALVIPLLLLILPNMRNGNFFTKTNLTTITLIFISIFLYISPLPNQNLTRASINTYLENYCLNNPETSDASPSKYKCTESYWNEYVDLTRLEEYKRHRLAGSSVSERIELLNLSIVAFLNNPILGVSNWEVHNGSYPHNLTLEAFQTVGAVGGTIFIVLIALCGYISWLRLKEGKYLISLLFLQALVAGQFSGSLYGHAQLWTTMALLLPYASSLSLKK